MRKLLLPLVNRILLLFCFCLTIFVPLVATQEAQAIPAFARTYDVNCRICHTRVPGLNRTGELFLENGYQLPGTNDRDTIEKSWLGDITSDRITNYPGFRLRGNFLRTEDYTRQTLGPNTYANPEDRTELGCPSEELQQEGLLSDKEYQRKRQRILEEL